jgi:hypothetical protein
MPGWRRPRRHKSRNHQDFPSFVTGPWLIQSLDGKIVNQITPITKAVRIFVKLFA